MAQQQEQDGSVIPIRDLEDIWPGQLPRSEVAIWAKMSATDRAKALSRLSAVVSYEASGRRDVPRHAAMAQVGEPRFYKMMRDWRADTSLLSLVPQATRRAPRAFTPPAGIEEAAMQAVRADHDRRANAYDGDRGSEGPDSSESIAVALRTRFGGPSLSWIRRLVASARRDLQRELAGGSAGFGRRVVIDSAALPLPLLPEGAEAGGGGENADDRAEEWAVAAFAWDGATGFVLGHVLDRAPANMRLHMSAASAASAFLRDLEDDGSIDAKPELLSTLPLEDRAHIETMRLIAKMDSVGAVAIHSPRAHGSELMTAFAGRMGALELRPRFAADGFVGRVTRTDALKRSDRVAMSLEQARLVLDVEVAKHNADARGSACAPAVRPRVVAEALDGLVAAIATN